MLGITEARYKPQYASQPQEVQQWYKTQHNDQGQWCCDESDGHDVFGNYVLNQDGSVDIDNHHIEPHQVLKGPNPTGHAVWWFIERGGEKITYCFAPGTLS